MNLRSLIVVAAGLLVVATPCMVAAQDSATDRTDGPPPNADQPHRGIFPIAVIYTNIATDTSSDVPGVPGAKFSSFDRPFGSPGTNWALTANTDLPTTEDEVLLVNGLVEVREGTPAGWTGDTENVGLLDTKLSINDAGAFAFAADTDGATTADEYIVLASPTETTFTTVAQEGGSADPPITGATWGSALESAVIAADGTVGFSSDNLAGPPTTENDVLVLGIALLAQEGVTVPTGQAAGGTEFWENFDLGGFWINATGTSWLAQGDLTGSTSSDDVVVVDGAVVLQEDSIIPGSGFPNPIDGSGIVGSHMDFAGNWMARGNNDTSETDWVVRNGTVIATLGDPVYTGATETWDDTTYSDCFFLHIGDANGNWIVGGVTDNVDTTINGLVVLNGDTEIMRESDPIDLDGNGLFDDNLFFNTFGNDDGYLAANGMYYFVATMKDDTGGGAGDGFFVADLSSVIPVELQSFSID